MCRYLHRQNGGGSEAEIFDSLYVTAAQHVACDAFFLKNFLCESGGAEGRGMWEDMVEEFLRTHACAFEG